MKDYNKYAVKISKLGRFCDIHQCSSANENHQVNLYFQLSEPYLIGYKIYVAFSFGEWSVDYSLNNSTEMRTDMTHLRGIKTDKEMIGKVTEIIELYRKQVA